MCDALYVFSKGRRRPFYAKLLPLSINYLIYHALDGGRRISPFSLGKAWPGAEKSITREPVAQMDWKLFYPSSWAF